MEPGTCAKEGALLSELTTKEVVGTCQVRSGTAGACSRPAAVELRGIPFCERCAREQQTYFAIGEFMEAEESSDGERLAVVMDLMKQHQIAPADARRARTRR